MGNIDTKAQDFRILPLRILPLRIGAILSQCMFLPFSPPSVLQEELRDLFTVSDAGLAASSTQQQLHALHSAQRKASPEVGEQPIVPT